MIGAAVAWQVAFNASEVVQNLVILNLPHPNGMARELANNPEQQRNSAYARRFIEGSADDPDIVFGGLDDGANACGLGARSSGKIVIRGSICAL